MLRASVVNCVGARGLTSTSSTPFPPSVGANGAVLPVGIGPSSGCSNSSKSSSMALPSSNPKGRTGRRLAPELDVRPPLAGDLGRALNVFGLMCCSVFSEDELLKYKMDANLPVVQVFINGLRI